MTIQWGFQQEKAGLLSRRTLEKEKERTLVRIDEERKSH
jgi:hypothetical protein